MDDGIFYTLYDYDEPNSGLREKQLHITHAGGNKFRFFLPEMFKLDAQQMTELGSLLIALAASQANDFESISELLDGYGIDSQEVLSNLAKIQGAIG